VSTNKAVLDFDTKTFDKVHHQQLLKKLEYYGIHGTLLTWMKSFVTGRYGTVVYEGRSSQVYTFTFRGSTGTILGPLLFLTYVNDPPDRLHSKVELFADDALLYGVIVHPYEKFGLLGEPGTFSFLKEYLALDNC